MISEDLDVKTLGPDEGIVWRTDGKAVVRVRIRPGMPDETGEQLVERLARTAAEHWCLHQVATMDRYDVVVRLARGWAGPVNITTSRPAAQVRSARHARYAPIPPRFEHELAEVARLRSEA